MLNERLPPHPSQFRTSKRALLKSLLKAMDKHTAKQFRDNIEIMVRAAAYTAAMGSRYMNFLLLHIIERGQSPPVVDQTFCRRNMARFWDNSDHRSTDVKEYEAAAFAAFSMDNDIPQATVHKGWGFA